MFGDDFLSGITSSVQQAAQSSAKDVLGFLSGGVKSTLIRIGPKPAGNLSETELAAGQRGGGDSVSGSTQDPSLLSAAGGALSSTPALIAVALAVGIGAYFIFGRK